MTHLLPFLLIFSLLLKDLNFFSYFLGVLPLGALPLVVLGILSLVLLAAIVTGGCLIFPNGFWLQ